MNNDDDDDDDGGSSDDGNDDGERQIKTTYRAMHNSILDTTDGVECVSDVTYESI